MSMFRVFSCDVGRGCLLWPVCSLGKTLLAFALLHSVFQGQICLLPQVFQGMANHFSIPALRTPWTVWVPLADLKTSWTYRGLWEALTHWWSACTSSLLLGTRMRKQIEAASGSGWFPENAPTCTFAHASHPLWPLYLQHNSPLEWTLPLLRRVFSVDEFMPKKFLRLKK